jgi:uncharacterized protein YegL
LLAKRIAALRERAASSTVDLDHLLEQLDAPLDTAGPTNLGGAAHAYRKTVLRALRHYDEQQRARFRTVVDAVEDAIRAEHVAQRARVRTAEGRAAWDVAREAYQRQLSLAADAF